MEDKKADIFHCAKQAFSARGFKDTNISDITKMVGIGVGTFYHYYLSKEKLFWEIYMKENEELKRSIIESVDPNGEPIMILKEVMRLNLEGMNSNPILKQWYNRDLFGKLEKEFYEQGGIEEIHKFMNSGTMELIKKWKTEGKIRNDLDDDFILALLNSIPYVEIHKEEIGIHHFPQILDYLAEFVMKGLMDCKKTE